MNRQAILAFALCTLPPWGFTSGTDAQAQGVAELRLDTSTLNRTLMRSPLGGLPDDAELSVRLFEKSHTREVRGITAMLDGPTVAPEGSFDLDRHVRLVGAAEGSTGAAPEGATIGPNAGPPRGPAVLGDVPPNGALAVRLQLQGLTAGQYAFSLRFYGIDADPQAPKLDVTVQVRDHVCWAILAVIVALLLSFFISKGVANWRDRLRVRTRVARLKQRRFDDHADLPSVVFLRAVLARTEKLAQHRLLPLPASVDEYLLRAERVVGVLTRFSAVRDAVDKAAILGSAKYHFNYAIGEAMNRMSAQPLDQKTADAIVDDLTAVQLRLNDPYPWVWMTLTTKAELLWQEARVVRSQLGDPRVVDPLLAKLASHPAAYDRQVDQAYWMVNLLYTRRSLPGDVTALVAAYARRKYLWDMFDEADELAWHRLTAYAQEDRIKIAPADANEPHETLRPIKFMLDFDDSAVGDSFLVTNVLKYRWEFTFIGKDGVEQPPQSLTLSGPRVTQFSQLEGHMRVQVTILWRAHDQTHAQPLKPLLLPIVKNSEMTLLGSLDNSEWLLMGVVALVTLATSLPALYFAKPTFGSFADYIAILAWAIGIDQGKNLIQLLNVFPAWDGGADSTAAATSSSPSRTSV